MLVGTIATVFINEDDIAMSEFKLPDISELDMCSYLMKCNNASNNCLNHGLFRDKSKSEAYTMMQDGFVESISIVTLLEGQKSADVDHMRLDRIHLLHWSAFQCVRVSFRQSPQMHHMFAKKS